ncbi:MAG: Hpt domain-containing protein, partial [Candidatus Methylumidiphilus sp.]
MSHADLSMVELFRIEVENQAAEIIKGLLELERDARSPKQLQSLMRSSHSIKGAARIVNLPNAVVLAHAMEDCFSAAQKGFKLKRPHFDLLLKGADHLARIALLDENKIAAWIADNTQTYSDLASSIRSAMTVQEDEPPASGHPPEKDAPRHRAGRRQRW